MTEDNTNPTAADPEHHSEVAAALEQLADLDQRPVDDHAEILAAVHERLHVTLNEHRTHETP